MDPVDAYREKIGDRLTRRLAQALKDHEITQDEFAEVASYILENIDNARTAPELVQLLEEIGSQWSFLSDVVTEEKNESQNQEVSEKVQQIDTLISQNKIDDALKVARGSTEEANQNQGQDSSQSQGGIS